MADEDARRSRCERDATSAEGANGATGAAAPSPEAGDAAADAGVVVPEEPGETERLRAELAALNDRWLRERAELENYKKRLAREKAEALRFGSEPLLRDLLPVIDDLHRALEHAPGSQVAGPIVQGIEMVVRALDQVLERHGVRVVDARGAVFDPSVHEAVGQVESQQPPNTVVDEHRRGYLLHDRLLRAAQVTVGKGRPPGGEDVEKAKGDG